MRDWRAELVEPPKADKMVSCPHPGGVFLVVATLFPPMVDNPIGAAYAGKFPRLVPLPALVRGLVTIAPIGDLSPLEFPPLGEGQRIGDYLCNSS